MSTIFSTDILDALNAAIDNQDEGVVVKDVNSYYCPNKRNAGWYKIKPEVHANYKVQDFLHFLFLGYIRRCFSRNVVLILVLHFDEVSSVELTLYFCHYT